MIAFFFKNKRRLDSNKFGMTIAELPAGLSIIFIGICMPLLCLVLTAARFALFWEAAREATDAACQAQTYITTTYTPASSGTATTITGATTLAQNTAVNVATMFSGLAVSPEDVQCYIVVTPLVNTGSGSPASTIVGPNSALTSAPDPTANLYQIRVDVSGQIQPVFPLPSSIFGNIPGLTQPFTIKLSTLRMLDNPQGAYISQSNS